MGGKAISYVYVWHGNRLKKQNPCRCPNDEWKEKNIPKIKSQIPRNEEHRKWKIPWINTFISQAKDYPFFAVLLPKTRSIFLIYDFCATCLVE
jgi:hypothetical protein